MKFNQLILIIFFVLLFNGCSELRIGEEALKERYLLDIPIGTKYTEVKNKLISTIQSENLIYHNKGGCSIDGNRVKGRIIRAYMGWHFDAMLPKNTFTMWCFNQSNILVDLRVIQETDGL